MILTDRILLHIQHEASQMVNTDFYKSTPILLLVIVLVI